MARKIRKARKKIVRTEVISIRFTKEEFEQIAAAAECDEQPVTTYCRMILNNASDPVTGWRATTKVTFTPLATAAT